MSAVLASSGATGSTAAARAVSSAPFRPAAWNTVGWMLVTPYVLVFLIFVLYPVGYGLYLARDPQR